MLPNDEPDMTLDGDEATSSQLNVEERDIVMMDEDVVEHCLCDTCGLFEDGCKCKDNVIVDDHDYGVSKTVRLHARTMRPLTRKRICNPSEWRDVKRKQLRQSGEAHVSSKGKEVLAKVVESCKRDHVRCRFQCAVKITEEHRRHIHSDHWSHTDQDKRCFYVRMSTVNTKERTRRNENKQENRKKLSYKYFLPTADGAEKIRVCKEFFLRTLSIDAKRVTNAHKGKSELTGLPRHYIWGKHSKRSGHESKILIRQHIESIPKIDSHYCRRDTNKTYVCGNLNMSILYEKYREYCLENGHVPAKIYRYRQQLPHLSPVSVLA